MHIPGIVRIILCTYDVADLMSLFCFMFIQGQQLKSASRDGDMTTVERLLKEDPHLVNYKGGYVRRRE